MIVLTVALALTVVIAVLIASNTGGPPANPPGSVRMSSAPTAPSSGAGSEPASRSSDPVLPAGVAPPTPAPEPGPEPTPPR